MQKGNGGAVNATRIQSLAHKLGKPQVNEMRSATDADLMMLFLDYHDEAAFEELVTRHLDAVRAICRSLLRDINDADDAAQATFLVLVRRAGAIRDRVALGSWLCRVAWRTANRLRLVNSQRASRQIAGIDPDSTPDRSQLVAHCDDRNVLEEEICRLPEQYRVAVLTCYRAGVPTAEAANRLGWSKGTLLTRLAWARKRLRERLLKRGVTLTGCLTTVLADHSSHAADAIIACRFVAAGMAIATGNPTAMGLVSERVSTLTEGMVRAMIGTKMKLTLGVGILIVALLGLGLGRLTIGAADAAAGDKKTTTVNSPLPGTEAAAKNTQAQNDPDATKAEPANQVPGSELVVRKPLGTYTREIPVIGKATVTFSENRMHALATIRIEKVSFSVTFEADYNMNRESMVYGIITGADIGGLGLGDEQAAGFAQFLALANDTPFCFRIRVEDDAIMVKDLKWGAIGSPLFTQAFAEGDAKGTLAEIMMGSSMLCGKYKADPNPERNLTLPPAKPKRK